MHRLGPIMLRAMYGHVVSEYLQDDSIKWNSRREAPTLNHIELIRGAAIHPAPEKCT